MNEPTAISRQSETRSGLPAPTSRRRARWALTPVEGLVMGGAALILIWQLLLPPVIGLADNGDFPRIMSRFDIGYPTAVVEERYMRHAIVRFPVDESHRWVSPFLSSELVFTWIAVQAHHLLSKSTLFDIRLLGTLHGLALLATFWIVLILTRRLGRAPRAILFAALLFLFLDVEYISYFNSFYSEPASYLFLLGFAVCSVGAAARPSAALLWWGAAAACALLFVLAKTQNAPAGPIFAVLALAIALTQQSAGKRFACAAAALILSASGAWLYSTTPSNVRAMALHTAVFFELLPNSPDPERDLERLGLDASWARYAGSWSGSVAGFPSRQFQARVSLLDVLRIYVLEPQRLLPMMDRSVAAAGERPPFGNFEKSTGAPPYQRSDSFAVGSRIRERWWPKRLFTLAGLWALAIAASLASRWTCPGPGVRSLLWAELCLVAIAFSQLLAVAVSSGTIESARHLLLLKVITDILVTTGACSLTAALFRRWSLRRPVLLPPGAAE